MNVIDDSYGKTVYNIPTSVIVMPNDQLANTLSDAILNKNPYSNVFIYLNSGNLNLVSLNVIAMSTVFNIQGANSTQNNHVASLREFFVEKLVALSVSDISSIKLIASAFSALTYIPEQISFKLAVIIHK